RSGFRAVLARSDGRGPGRRHGVAGRTEGDQARTPAAGRAPGGRSLRTEDRAETRTARGATDAGCGPDRLRPGAVAADGLRVHERRGNRRSETGDPPSGTAPECA